MQPTLTEGKGTKKMELPNVSPTFSHYYMHDVTPSVVPSAVRIEISTCTINFQVSFFIIIHFSLFRSTFGRFVPLGQRLFTFHFLLKLLISCTLIVVTTARSVVRRAA